MGEQETTKEHSVDTSVSVSTSHSSLYRQASTPSVISASSDRLSKSSCGSFSDADHDNG